MYRRGSAIEFAFKCVDGMDCGEKRTVSLDEMRYQSVSLTTMRSSLYSVSVNSMVTLKTKLSTDRQSLIIERIC